MATRESEEKTPATRAERVNDLLRFEALKSGVKMAEGLVILVSGPFQIAGLCMGLLKNSVDLLSTVASDSIERTIESNSQSRDFFEQNIKENNKVQQRKSLLLTIETTTVDTLKQMSAALKSYIEAQHLFLSACIFILKKRNCPKKRNLLIFSSYDCNGTETGVLIQELENLTEESKAAVFELNSFQKMITATLANKSVETGTSLDDLVDGSNEQILSIIQQARGTSNRVFNLFSEFGLKLQKKLREASNTQSAASNPMLLNTNGSVHDPTTGSSEIEPLSRADSTLTSTENLSMVPSVHDPTAESSEIEPISRADSTLSSENLSMVPLVHDELPENVDDTELAEDEPRATKQMDGGRRTKKRKQSLRKSKKTRLGRRSRQNRRRTRTAI